MRRILCRPSSFRLLRRATLRLTAVIQHSTAIRLIGKSAMD
ncbi:MAG: hypothetical protein ACK40X_14420 [Armatimonadota bacterium]